MGYLDERHKKDLAEFEAAQERDRKFSLKIKQEAEAPIHSAAELLLLHGKMKHAGTMGRHVEGIRQKYQRNPWTGGDAPLVDVKATKPDYEGIIQNVWNYKNNGNAVRPNFELMGTNPADTSKQMYSWENRPIYIPPEERIGTQKGEPLMTTTGGDRPVEDWIYSTEGANFDRQRSDRLGLEAGNFDSPQQERTWYAKVTYPRVLDEVLAQGGTEDQAKEIFAIHRKNFLPYSKGGSGMVASISELNRMAEKYAKGIQIRSATYTKDGKDYYRWLFKDKDGLHTRWDFEREEIDGIVKEYSKTQWAKDHIIPVKDRNRVGGGYIGADNEYNLEHLLQWLNVQKSNTTQLYPGILQEMGVPETFSEYINMKLYPQNYEGMFIPQRFKENFQKIVMAEYNEKSRGVQSGRKRAQIMNKIISIHAERFKDPVIIKGLEMLEEALGQQIAKNMEEGVAAGNEVPAWLGLLQKPPGGWNSKDPWWTSLPKDAQTRYKYIYDYKQRTILKEPYKRPPLRQDRKD